MYIRAVSAKIQYNTPMQILTLVLINSVVGAIHCIHEYIYQEACL